MRGAASPGFEGRSSLRTWLYRIATNACLKADSSDGRNACCRSTSGPPSDPHDRPGEPLVESVWIEPYPDAALGPEPGGSAPGARYDQLEGVELAFIAALQHLPARQRAVLILRDVLGFSAREVARVLETTPASVHSALQRAHKAVDERLPEPSQQATLRTLGDAGASRHRPRVRRRLGAGRRRRGRRDADRRRDDRDAPDRNVVPRSRRRRRLSPRMAARRRDAVAPASGRGTGNRRSATTCGTTRSAASCPTASTCSRSAAGGSDEITAFLTPEAFPRFGLPDEM